MIEELFLNIIEITISTSFIIVSLLILSPILKKKYTAKWQYLIWIIVSVKLLIPFKLSLPEEFFQIPIPISIETNVYKETEPFEYPMTKDNNKLSSDSLTSITNENVNINTPINEPISNTSKKTLHSSNLNITSLKFFSFCWLIGVLLFLIYQFLGYFTLKKKLLRWSTQANDEEIYMCLKETCNEIQLSNSIKIMKCKTLSSPMVMGLLHPIILLPEKRIALESLSIILKHEVIHIKDHDILYKLLLLSELQALWEEEISKAPNPKGGLGIKVMTEEGENIYYDAALKNIKSSITDSFGERVSDKILGISKAYYELQINVTDPGNSSFENGENIRWLYLSASEKSSATSSAIHWIVEELVTSGEPDELWWDIISGG